jgi:hypothetical protein
MISFDLSATLTWPSTRRWRAAKAHTIWVAAFPFLYRPGAGALVCMALGRYNSRADGGVSHPPVGRRDPGDYSVLATVGYGGGDRLYVDLSRPGATDGTARRGDVYPGPAQGRDARR